MSIDIYAVLEKFKQSWEHNARFTGQVQAIDSLITHLRVAEQTGYLGTLYRTDFEVQGTGGFPVDMLRYTCAWPKDETDVFAIEESLLDNLADEARRTITLSKYHRDPEPVLAGDRWEAKFRWRVVRVIETVTL